jgi:uncharacterized protein YbbK (DUF523 family)
MTDRPRVGISRCLLGDAVRYDGTHKRDDALIGALGRHVEWVPVCPEVEVGMGTPREPIRLVARREGVPSAGAVVWLIGVSSGRDWTERMHAWARERAHALIPLDLAGYIFKARSPSCGIHGVPVHDGDVEREGRGLFAQALIDALPDLPVADEEGLADPRAREEFLQRVLNHHGRNQEGGGRR